MNYTLGITVKRGRKRYVVSGWRIVEHTDGSFMKFWVLTPIPKGLTARDMGRKFDGALTELEGFCGRSK